MCLLCNQFFLITQPNYKKAQTSDFCILCCQISASAGRILKNVIVFFSQWQRISFLPRFVQSDCGVHCLLRLPSNHISRIYGLEFASRQSGGLRLTLWTWAKKELASFTGAAAEEAHRLVLQDCWQKGRQRSEWSALACTLEIQSVFLYAEGAEVSLNPRRSTPQEHFKGGRVILAPSLRVQSTRWGSRHEARQLFLASVLR